MTNKTRAASWKFMCQKPYPHGTRMCFNLNR